MLYSNLLRQPSKRHLKISLPLLSTRPNRRRFSPFQPPLNTLLLKFQPRFIRLINRSKQAQVIPSYTINSTSRFQSSHRGFPSWNYIIHIQLKMGCCSGKTQRPTPRPYTLPTQENPPVKKKETVEKAAARTTYGGYEIVILEPEANAWGYEPEYVP